MDLAWALLAAVLWRKLPFSCSSLVFPSPQSHCRLWKKKVPSLEAIQSAQFITRGLVGCVKMKLVSTNSFSVSVQFSFFTRPAAIINYSRISLCILGKHRVASRPLIPLLMSVMQWQWESRERECGISFYWGDRRVDLLLESNITKITNYSANSKRCLWGPKLCGASDEFTQILYTQHFRSAEDGGVSRPCPVCMTAVISYLHLALSMPLQDVGEISRFG